MQLARWSETFRVVDTEGGHVARVRLLTPDGETWHTWEREEIIDPEWFRNAGEFQMALADSLPAGRHSIQFVAEDHAGNVRSQLPTTCVGRSREKKAPSETVAIVQAMESLTRTMQTMLDSQNDMIERQGKFIVASLERQNELTQALLERDEKEDTGAVQTMILQQLAENGGPILALLPDVMKAYASSKAPTRPPLAAVPKG